MRSVSTLMMLALLMLAAPASAQMLAGKVERIQGQATVTRVTNVIPLAVGNDVLEGDILRTGAEARLTVALVDGSSLTLGADGEIELDEFIYSGEVARDRSTMRWVTGAFLTATGAIGRANLESVTVTTPVATIGIRGTQFWGGRLEVDFEVLVLEGRVVVTNPAGTVELGVNETTSVANLGASPTPAAVMPVPRRNQAVATVTYN